MKAVSVKEMSPPTRGRKANYSVEENLFLAEKYEEHKNTIDAKHKDAGTNKIKKVERSLDDLKSRLSKLNSESRVCLQSITTSRKITGVEKQLRNQMLPNKQYWTYVRTRPGSKGWRVSNPLKNVYRKCLMLKVSNVFF